MAMIDVKLAPKASRLTLMLFMALVALQQAAAAATAANASGTDISDNELSMLSPCAVACYSRDCDFSNTTCVCQIDWSDRIRDCLLDTCTLPEALYSNNITKTFCHAPVRNQVVRFNVMCLTFGLIAGATVVLRLGFKQFFSTTRRLETDDWIILSALPLGLTCIILEVAGLTTNGLGVDMWGLTRSSLEAFGVYFYAMQLLYLILIGLVKLSLVFFYMKIFPGRRTRYVLWALVVFHVGFTSGFVIGVVFQCLPIDSQWTKYDWRNGPLPPGSCLDINAAGWAHGAFNIVSDFCLLGVPISQVRKLRLHWKKKIGVCLMFLTGLIATIVSFLRLSALPRYGSTTNPPWDEFDVVWWSTVEICVGLICTSLPALRLILLRFSPRVFGTDSQSHPHTAISA